MKNLKEHWHIKSNSQIFIIILVFAITGSSSALVSKPLLFCLGITKMNSPIWLYILLYITLIFPIYQLLLLLFGFVFGQFHFFWNFEKKLLKNIGLGFLFQKKKKKTN